VTGVSGSGKSSLVNDTLHPALRRVKGEVPKEVGPHDGVIGAEWIDGVVLVDQSPIGRTPRSNPVTYIGAFAEIRQAFADTPLARARGLSAGHFSFNRPGGRCEACQGQGVVTAEMHFLADVTLTCEACGGTRYKENTLGVRVRGRTIAEVLRMTVAEAIRFFRDRPKLVKRLSLLGGVGLGYLRLGQAAATLSGGEAQRLKLAEAMSKGRGRTLYLFDEPTTGLHLEDVATLMTCLRRLLEHGHSVLVVEHHLDVIRSSDWIIDLGPEAADAGGNLVVCGTPEQVARCTDSLTGRYLAPLLARSGRTPAEAGETPRRSSRVAESRDPG
jgi:excinuclease ABC subunit A